MTYSFKLNNNRLRFYLDDTSVNVNQIPRDIYLQLLNDYRIYQSKKQMYYYQVLPKELKQALLSNVDLDTLDMLTAKISDFRTAADIKFWEKMLLTDICRKIPDVIHNNLKDVYFDAMRLMEMLHRDILFHGENVKLDIQPFKRCVILPELLLEQIFALCPRFWAAEYLKEFVDCGATVEFFENFMALDPDKNISIDKLTTQDNKILELFSDCLFSAIHNKNMDLAHYLCAKNIKLSHNDSLKYIYHDCLSWPNNHDLAFCELLINCDPNYKSHINWSLDGMWHETTDEKHNYQLARLIRCFLSKGASLDKIRRAKSVKGFLEKFQENPL